VDQIRGTITNQMVRKEGCPLENVSQSSWMYMMGETRIART